MNAWLCWSARKPQAGARRQRTTRESSLLEIVGIWVTCLRVFTDRLRVWITCVWLLSTYQSGSSPVVRLPCDFCYRELQGWVIYKFVSVLSCFRNTVRENWSINLDVKGIYYLLHNGRRRRKFWHFILNKCIFKYEIGDSLSVFLKKFPPPAEVPLLKKTLRLRVQQMPVQQNLRFRAAGGGGMQNQMSSTGALSSLPPSNFAKTQVVAPLRGTPQIEI